MDKEENGLLGINKRCLLVPGQEVIFRQIFESVRKGLPNFASPVQNNMAEKVVAGTGHFDNVMEKPKVVY